MPAPVRPVCALPLPALDAVQLCGSCQRKPRPQALVASACVYAAPVDGLLRRFKFHQDLAAGRVLAAMLQSRCAGLQRVRATAPQSELDASARRRNLRHAFAVQSPLPPHVTLIDDVMTTGATLHAAAQALRRAGVARVDA